MIPKGNDTLRGPDLAVAFRAGTQLRVRREVCLKDYSREWLSALQPALFAGRSTCGLVLG